MNAPSGAFLGRATEPLARRALRAAGSAGEVGLLLRWGAPGSRPGSGRTGFSRAAARRVLADVQESLPEGWSGGLDGAVVVVDAPLDAPSSHLLDLIERHAGPLAVVIGGRRGDEVDAVLRAVDEVVAIEPSTPALHALLGEELAMVARHVSFVAAPRRPWATIVGGQSGQSTVVVVALIALVLSVAGGLGLVASALGRTADVQGRADVAALAAAEAMRVAQPLLYSVDRSQVISEAEFRRRGRAAAERTAAANDLRVKEILYVGDDDKALPAGELPTRVRITARAAEADGEGDRLVRSTAEVAVAPLDDGGMATGDYTGPLAVRQGQRMRPDVALAFDRMAAAARGAGLSLVIVSAYRSDAEQAELFRRHPDPKWVARPGTSLHRLGTELDLGPNAAWSWLAANSTKFGFLKRYSWEAWHFGYVRSPGSASVGYRERKGGGSTKGGSGSTTATAGRAGSGERSGSAIPSFVPAQFAPMIARASQRWSVGAALLAAQEWQESKFNPRAVSSAGAAGIAQFMPATGIAYGLSPAERFDPAKAIDAQAHYMHDLLKQFGSVPLALAAYNAGSGNVSKCMCIPPFPETQAYVQAILAKLGAAGMSAPAGLQIRLVA
ncbi:MAG: transglycosylase SLT domain-containing protein [Solirubrobacteraceae bacterium]|nr:transglycosylase SLT domain-containing protein [Solirubrobacteraceae bacterium]